MLGPPDEHRETIRRTLAPKLIAEPLASRLRNDDATGNQLYDVIIELNLSFPGQRAGGAEAVKGAIRRATAGRGGDPLSRNIDGATHPYIFAELTRDEIYAILDAETPNFAVFRIWESTKDWPLTTVSVRTVKADAAYTAFSARGTDIV